MSSAVYFLLGAIGFCMLGFVALWLLHREPKATTDRSVTTFSGNLQAIAPKPEPATPRRTAESPIPGGMAGGEQRGEQRGEQGLADSLPDTNEQR